jgi:hypothetical protein
MANPLLWLRLFAAVGLLGFASIATRLGCVGNPAVLSLPQDRGLWIERHAEKVAEARRRRGQVDLLFVGDSITQNYERFNADP